MNLNGGTIVVPNFPRKMRDRLNNEIFMMVRKVYLFAYARKSNKSMNFWGYLVRQRDKTLNCHSKLLFCA